MTVRAFLLTPWQATPRVVRLCLLLLLAGCLVYGTSVAAGPASPQQWLMFVLYYGGALSAAWILVLSRLVLLARDRIQLVLPGKALLLPCSLVFHAVGGLVPALALGIVAHAPLFATAIYLLLFMAGGLTLALLPGYVAAVAGFVPLIGTALSGHLHVLTHGQVEALALVVLLVLAACCVMRWRMVVRSDRFAMASVHGALIFQLQRQVNPSGAGHENGAGTSSGVVSGWRGAMTLKNTGPAAVPRALRVALGGLYLPRTPAGHVYRLLPLVIAAAVLMTAAYGFDVPALLSPSNFALSVSYLALVLTMASTFGVVKLMQQRWRKPNAELAVLALLPGLGTPEVARQRLLRASLAGPLTLHAVILASVWLTAWLAPMPRMTVALISLVVPGCSLVMTGLVLATLGGRRLPDWAMMTLMLVFLALTNACLLPVVLFRAAGAVSTAYLAVPLAGWVLLGIVLAWLGLRGWVGFQRRPHVFLPNEGHHPD